LQAQFGLEGRDAPRIAIGCRITVSACSHGRWRHFVLSDGRISIARAFVPEDWRRLVAAAGLAHGDVAITWHQAVP
jgi:hypothetical protein